MSMDDDIDEAPYPGYWDDVAAAEALFVPRDPVDQVTDIATLIAHHMADQYRSVAALRREALADAGAGGLANEMVDRSLRLELASALRVTEYEVGGLMARATALVEQYPQALAALDCARITDQHVRFLVAVLGDARPGVAERLIDRAVLLAERLPAGSFRRKLRALLEEEEAATLTERHTRALDARTVTFSPGTDGMGYLTVYGPAVELHAVFDRITRVAKAITGRGATGADGVPEGTSEGVPDARTLDQTRTDVACDLLIDGVCAEYPSAAGGVRASVVVTVPALSLLDDEHAAAHPATVEGLGPIPITRARELCGGAAKWMRVLTHPETGMVLSVGRTRYDPPPELKRLIRWRAERCMAPGCTMPASRCEIDHNEAWHDGGSTCLDNHCPLCTGHHHVKHHGGWIVTQIPDSGGVIEWISPYGRRYLIEPERRVPIFRPAPEIETAPF